MTAKEEKGFFDEDEIQNCMDRIKATIRRIVVNEIDAEDLAQEVFIKAWKNAGSFQEKAKIYTWLYKIAINTTYTFLSKNKNKKVYACSQLPESADLSPSTLDKMIYEEEMEMETGVGKFLQMLSPKLKSAIVLTILHGMDTGDVAKMEGCSEATIYWRIHQAKKELKLKLAQ
ncbi:RNA polymerase sigma factor [Candidatus Uabimicrobium sp. HlEnr_7]|uniref:RNA polymerase sigma factor n=1 Tax=Candidatus Uabimicrobium helgolandensis TaxID=3095367 RepID=UPI00355794E0